MIIDAAEKLLVKGAFPLPSVNQIITQAGVAKGTVYLYFTSKEEIYLSFLAQSFEKFVKLFVTKISNSKTDTLISDITDEFLKFAKQQPKAVYLASIVPLILENNLSDKFILEFKTSLFLISKTMSSTIAKIANQDDNSEFFTRFMVGYNHFLAMWQHCNPPPQVLEIMQDNQLDDLIYDFDSEFRNQMRRLWQDLIQ